MAFSKKEKRVGRCLKYVHIISLEVATHSYRNCCSRYRAAKTDTKMAMIKFIVFKYIYEGTSDWRDN